MSTVSRASTTASQKRDRMKTLLADKVIEMIKKTNKTAKITSDVNAFISKQLDGVLKEGKGTESELKKIAQAAASLISKPSTASSVVSKRSVPPLDTQSLSATQSEAGRSVQAKSDKTDDEEIIGTLGGLFGNGIKRKENNKVEDIWAAMALKDAEEYHQQQHNEFLQHKQKQIQLRDTLLSQSEQNKLNSKRRQEAEQAYIEQQKAIVERQVEEEKMKEEERRLRILEEKKIRDQQLEQSKLRKEMVEKKKKEEEEELVEKLKKQILKEKERDATKKDQHKKELASFLSYNDTLKARKEEEFKKELEEDIKCMKVYEEKQRMEELRREMEIKKLYERQSVAMALSNKLEANLEEKEKEDELKAQKVQAEFERKKDLELKQKKEKEAQIKANIKRTLDSQIKTKMDHRKELYMEDQREKQRIEEDILKAEEEEKQRKLRYKEGLKSHRDKLSEQVKEKEMVQAKKGVMSDIEMKLNADRIRSLQQQ